MWIQRTDGLSLEPIGEGWLAFSADSGETHQLNEEALAVLDLLAAGAMSVEHLCDLLAVETGLDVNQIHKTLSPALPVLESAGLVQLSPALRAA